MDETLNKKVERLQKMFDYARANNLCTNKTTFAELVGFTASNMSRAFSGIQRYLTDNLLTRVNQAIGSAFTTEWVLYGTGEIYAAQPSVPAQPEEQPVQAPAQEVSSDSSRVRELEYVIETQKKLIEMLERENEDLKKENYYASVRAKNA